MLGDGGPHIFRGTDEATIERIVDVLVEQRNARAVTSGILSVFVVPGVRDLYRDVLIDSLSATSGPLAEAHALEVDGIIRATYIGGTHHGRDSCHLNSFREDELKNATPGEQLLLDVLKCCCERGLTQLDLGIGEMSYKVSWCKPDPLFDSSLPMTALGRLHALLAETKQSVKRSIKANPLLWKTILKLRRLRSHSHG